MQAIFDETYKRGLFTTRVEVFTDQIRITRGKKDVRSAKIADIHTLNYYSAPSRYDHYHCFWIDAGEMRLYIQGSERGPLPDASGGFHRSVAAVLKQVERKKPDVGVTGNAGETVRWLYFSTFALVSLAGALLGFLAIFEQPLVGLGAFAITSPWAILAWAFKPWGDPSSVSVGDFREAWGAMEDGAEPEEPMAA